MHVANLSAEAPSRVSELAASIEESVFSALAFPSGRKFQFGVSGDSRPGLLVLNDGSKFEGLTFGSRRSALGEVVFNTGMTGYPESLTDPSYAGQVLVLTFPLVGNYGVPPDEKDVFELPKYWEGSRVSVRALIVAECNGSPVSHFEASKSLSEWLNEQRVPGLQGVDTRALTKHLREHGAMLGKVVVLTEEEEKEVMEEVDSPETGLQLQALFQRLLKRPVFATALCEENPSAEVRELSSHLQDALRERLRGAFLLKAWREKLEAKAAALPFEDPNASNLVAAVSCKAPRLLKSPLNPDAPPLRILAVDCGMKANITRLLLNHGVGFHATVHLKIVPWDYDFSQEEFDGLFLSNGPGDPSQCDATIKHIRACLSKERPIFGVCLGNQLLALAAGATTYKMKFGNRGLNQPVIDLRTKRCYMSSQNHGFAVDAESLRPDFVPLFVNANDQTIEGIAHKTRPFFAVQFHPEAAGGPTDTFFLFEEFFDLLRKEQVKQVARGLTIQPYRFRASERKVLLLGSGGLSIGQAGEFDYSGSQAMKALREEGIRVVLVNPNIATVQTSKSMADRVYFVPVTPEFVANVIEKEQPQGILCTFGGQTALNCVIALHNSGILKRHHCRILGTPIEAIIATEDRKLFAEKLAEINELVATSKAAYDLESAVEAAAEIGYPVLVRAAYALGGLGSGFAENERALRRICADAFAYSKQVFIDRSLRGWKEIEYEVVRDASDNCITVCNMENLDPLGIHTGDSIVVAPSQTLNNTEYYNLRRVALKVVRHFGIIGECNIQYALDPNSSTYYIVEVNARLSRSSALASKASGYPLAYIAAKLSLGYDLLDLCNEVTKKTTACFEPSLDYVVTKVPRWDMRKFDWADPYMGSAMKSVGEVMAIGRTFEESFQKALRMVNSSANGFDETVYTAHLPKGSRSPAEDATTAAKKNLLEELRQPSAARIWALAEAFRQDLSVDAIYELTKIDRWFLEKLRHISDIKRFLSKKTLLQLSRQDLLYAKKFGFSDKQLAAYLRPVTRGGYAVTEADVRCLRQQMGVVPVVKQIDTLAAEFPAETNYLYLTYQGSDNDVAPLAPLVAGDSEGILTPESHTTAHSPCQSRPPEHEEEDGEASPCGRALDEEDSISGALRRMNSRRRTSPEALLAYVVLGCGCYCVGSSVEFDWSAMSCVRTLRSLSHLAIVVNCNPETVSTDHDVSDRLYFEDLTLETVLSIWAFERPAGVVVSVGGQTPNTLSTALEAHNVRIMGTRAMSIDCCEDRHKFSRLCDELQIDQPAWREFSTFEQAKAFSNQVGYPVLVRPSYVLSGAAMRVVVNDQQLKDFLEVATVVSGDSPVVISKFIEQAKEVEFDCVASQGEILNYAISEHVENAGTHSGDATLILPPQKVYIETIRKVKRIAQKLAKALEVSGPFNIQFISKRNEVKVIECNLRASRTFPYISKALGVDMIEQATKVMVGAPVAPKAIHLTDTDFVCVKVPVFSFSRLRGCDPVLGVEMRSTGEVACFGTDKHEAFLKALVSTGFTLPLKKRTVLLSTGPHWSKMDFLQYASMLLRMDFTIYATEGTHNFISRELPSLAEKRARDLRGSKAGGSLDAMDDLSKRLVLVTKLDEETKGVPSARQLLEQGEIELVINVPEGVTEKETSFGYTLRRAAIDTAVPLMTDIKAAGMLVESLHKKLSRESQGRRFWEVKPWDAYQS